MTVQGIRKITSTPSWINTKQFSWQRLTIRCGSRDCSLRWKDQPAMLARFRGIQFQNRWYHETACLVETLLTAVKQILPRAVPPCRRSHRLPLGLLLVQRGAISPEELREALQLQRQACTGKIGYWLRQFTTLTEEQICSALSQQWGCPVFPLNPKTMPLITDDAPPFPLLAAAKAVPAFTTSDRGQMHIAFSDRIDHKLLYALEEVLGCRTYPCVARESAVAEALEQFRKHSTGNEICFDTVRDPAEIAATICSYVTQMDSREVKIVPVAGYLWVAFFRKKIRRDLLFRVPSTPVIREQHLLNEIKTFPELADIWRDGVVAAAGPL